MAQGGSEARCALFIRRGAGGAEGRRKRSGPGLLEDAYKLSLAHALRQDAHRLLREVRLDITWEGLSISHAYTMDLVVDDKVVVEAKTVEKFADAHFAQVNSYLYFSGLEVGLLLNFRAWPLREGGIRRIVNTKP